MLQPLGYRCLPRGFFCLAKERLTMALILSRKLNEGALISTSDGVIRVWVANYRPSGFRLGFDAPAAVPIYREELRESWKQSNRKLSQKQKADLYQLLTDYRAGPSYGVTFAEFTYEATKAIEEICYPVPKAAKGASRE